MLKYVDTLIAFSEMPKEVALCINLSGCRKACKPTLQEFDGIK